MNVRKMSLEELEQLSYADIAYEILKLDKKGKTTAELFSEVCNLLEIDESNMMEMIGDFYTSLMTDKRFILLDNAKWDLKELHSVKAVIEDDEEDAEEEEETETEVEGTEDDAVSNGIDDYDDTDDDLDDLEDLAIVTEEEMDE